MLDERGAVIRLPRSWGRRLLVIQLPIRRCKNETLWASTGTIGLVLDPVVASNVSQKGVCRKITAVWCSSSYEAVRGVGVCRHRVRFVFRGHPVQPSKKRVHAGDVS